jgi:hypothetical protein
MEQWQSILKGEEEQINMTAITANIILTRRSNKICPNITDSAARDVRPQRSKKS